MRRTLVPLEKRYRLRALNGGPCGEGCRPAQEMLQLVRYSKRPVQMEGELWRRPPRRMWFKRSMRRGKI